jgi:type I restriction enzyme S subunit
MRDKFQRVKQGLVQDLLSGRVRTHNKDIEVLPEVAKYD